MTPVESLAFAGQFGITLAFAVGVGLFAGQWLDGHLHTGIVFTLIGAFLGLVLAILGFLRLYRSSLASRTGQRSWTSASTHQPAEDQSE